MDCFIVNQNKYNLAIDIGTKHFAYCLYYFENNNFIFNIMEISKQDKINSLINWIDSLPDGLTEIVPKNKFSYLNENMKEMNYRKRKQKSVDYAKKILYKLNESKLNELIKLNKKDDVSDSICMCVMSYLNKGSNRKSLFDGFSTASIKISGTQDTSFKTSILSIICSLIFGSK